MADPIIKIKRSGVEGKIPTVDNLQLGELAVNTFDGKLYIEKDQSNVGIATTIIVVNPWSVGTGTNTYNTYFNSGFVGIGTTNPSSKLSVVGDGLFTGVVTASSFSGNALSATYADVAGVSTSVIGGIASVTSLSVSGISTLGVTSAIDLTSQQLNVSGVSTLAGKIVSGNGIGNTNLSNTLNYSSSTGIAAFRPISLVDSAAGIKISRNGGQTLGAAIELQTWDVGIVTNYSYWDVNAQSGYFGIRDIKNSRSRIFIDDSGSILLGATSSNFTTNYNQLVGVGTDKLLNVLGNSYISGSVGIGTTNPSSKLSVVGNGNFTGIVTASSFSGNASSATYATIAGVSTDVIGGIASVTSLSVSGISTLDGASTTNLTAQQLNVSGITTVGFITATNLYVAGVGTFLSSGLNIRNPANTFGYTIAGGAIGANYTLALPVVTSNTGIAVTGLNQTFTGTQTFSALTATGTLTVSGALSVTSANITHTGTTQNFTAASYTTGTVTIGGPLQTGTITVGQATTSQTLNLATGVSLASTTKTINFGTGGASGSFTQINIGSTAGVGTVLINSGTRLGIGSAIPRAALDVVGDGRVSGVVTATTFVGALSGTATTASSVVVDSVGLGTHTYGDYVRDITGTSNQITVTSGTGEGSTPTLSLPNNLVLPQDVTVTRDLQVNRNLNVTGNITLGGTTAFINVQELVVSDPDLVLGYRTDAFGNDVSNDNTANHGGIAVASTEGTPLVSLFIAGIETAPATYKKIMWFKSGTFAGLGTDAWLTNYAVGIGSTQFPTGTRLAAGSVQFTENDLAVVRNINASGIGTIPTLSGTTATYNTGNFTTGNIVTGIVTNISGTNLNYTGVGTITSLNSTTGNITTLNSTTGNIVTGIVTNISGTNLNYTGVGTITTLNSTNTNLTNINSTGISTLGVTSATNLTAQQLNVSGVSTLGIATFTGAVSFGTSAYFGDNDTAYFGDGNDLRIYHDGSNSFIQDLGTGGLYLAGSSVISLQSAAGETKLVARTDGAVELYFDNVKEFETTGYGATVFGILQTQGLQVNSGVSTVGFLTATNIWNAGITTSSRLTLNGANSTADGGGQIFLNGATGNRIDFNTNGVAAPAFTTRSAGTKLVLYPNISGSRVDYALGIEGSTLWYSVDQTSAQHRWYAATTQLADLKGTGELVIGSTSLTGTASQRLQVTGGGYFSGSVGIGTTNPEKLLHLVTSIATPLIIQRTTTNNNAIEYRNSTSSMWAGLITSANGWGVGATADLGADAQIVVTRTGGELLVGSLSATGTASQKLQVTGGAYVSGNLGVGVTNPTAKLQVVGDANFTGVVTASSFSGNASSATYATSSGIATYATTAGVSTSVIGGIGSITQLQVSGISTFTNGPVLIGSGTSTGTASQRLQVTGGAYVSTRLGVGVTNPAYNIDVTGSVGITTTSGDALILSSTLSNGRNSIVLNTNGNDWEISAKGSASTPANSFYIYDKTNGAYRQVIDSSGNVLLGGATVATGTASQPLQVNGGAYVSGNIGIGTTNPTSSLHVVGNAYITGVTTSTDFDSLSDINFKTNINQITNPLEKVMQIRGVTFNWKDGNRNSAGVIAQEIEKVLPELVHGGETKTVNYNGLIGLLIECVKKQQEEIDELKRKVN
jgi:hypothetical protein